MHPDEQCINLLLKLVNELPEQHRNTLKYLMGHFCRICQMQHSRGLREPPTILIQVMCYILIRPPWEQIM